MNLQDSCLPKSNDHDLNGSPFAPSTSSSISKSHSAFDSILSSNSISTLTPSSSSNSTTTTTSYILGTNPITRQHQTEHNITITDKKSSIVTRLSTPPPIISSSNTNESSQDSVVTPFLVKHISDQSLIPHNNYHKYCYRHNPDITCNKSTDEDKMIKIQSALEKLPSRDQEAISHVWSIFSAAPSQHRQLILQGMLSQCCFPQLSFISQEVSTLIRIDFITTLPVELSLRILCYLDCRSLCNAAQVSKKWKSLADDDRVWHHMCEQHIDRKCPNCGWGLPLMHMKRARENAEEEIAPIKRRHEEISDDLVEGNGSSSSQPESSQPAEDSSNKRPKIEELSNTTTVSPPKVLKKRPWKSVYSERYKLEKNWRNGTYTIKRFLGHTDGVTCLQFNRKYLMTGSYDTTIKIWKIDTGECLKTLEGHTKGVRSLVFDNQKLITGGLDSTIKVWNYHTGQCIATYRGHEDSVVSVDFSGKSIVSGSADHTVKVWHVDSRTCYTLRGHTDWVNCVKIHPASNTIFSASDDTTIRMWDLQNNQCLRIFGGAGNNGHIGQVQTVIAFTYKEDLIEDESESENETHKPHHNGGIHPTIIGQARNEAQQQQERDRQQDLQQFNNIEENVEVEQQPQETSNDLLWDPTYPTHLLTSSLDNTIKLWDVKTGKCIRTQFGHIEGVWSIAADTFRIISGAHDRLIKVWDLQNGKCLHTFGNPSSVSCVGLSDSKFAAGLDNGVVKMYCF
ncbi:ubiquitin ligase complex component [Scheffersomyces coipomensis]|uniref:ubiquitin ligase complex component n=1 Tax=Scheffersomyces coipomensis TaxID=1788519 RepID=UPI00315CF0F7